MSTAVVESVKCPLCGGLNLEHEQGVCPGPIGGWEAVDGPPAPKPDTLDLAARMINWCVERGVVPTNLRVGTYDFEKRIDLKYDDFVRLFAGQSAKRALTSSGEFYVYEIQLPEFSVHTIGESGRTQHEHETVTIQ